jgi:aryl-alcohol dehydrogenase-like predicted oxidoreductase
VDCYLLHYDCESIAIQKIVDTLHELRVKGRILSFGLSNLTFKRVQQAHDYCTLNGMIPARFVSAHFGLMAWNAPYWKNAQTLVGPENRAARAWYENTGYSILAYSPLGRGYFKSKAGPSHQATLDDSAANGERYHRACELARTKSVSPAQIGLAYLLSQGSNTLAVIGCRTVEHLHANAAASGIALSRTECSWLAMESEPAG